MTSWNENTDKWILRILDGEAMPGELREFSEWLKIPENEIYFSRLKKLWNLNSGPEVSPEKIEAELRRFREYIKKSRSRKILRMHFFRPVLKWTAIFLLPLVIAISLFKNPVNNHSVDLSPAVIVPGGAKAVLTAADGSRVELKTGGVQEIVQVGHNSFIQNNSGVIVYKDTAILHSPVQYNRLAVPRGGEFRIVLSDGTEVYMNSASELKYPVAFEKGKREVYLSGEAYFIVKKDTSRPFLVHTDAVDIKVYGTLFNVNTLMGGITEVVLESGSVGVTGKMQATESKLRPSQLARFSNTGVLQKICNVDVRPYVAWKDGLFIFEDMSLEDIFERLSIWYDVDVFYANSEIKQYRFTGYMQRYQQIETILNAIHKIVGVNFLIKERTIVVEK